MMEAPPMSDVTAHWPMLGRPKWFESWPI